MKNSEQTTATPSRYLWAVDLDLPRFPVNSVIADRYRVVHSQVVIDTQSYHLPEIPDEFSEQAVIYLRLAKHILHLPRPYALLTNESGTEELLLFENVPIDLEGQLHPTLLTQLASANPMRQINWLWQILHLWIILRDYDLCQSLLNTDFLRVDGSWLRLLQYQPYSQEVSITQLGDLWQEWLDYLRPEISEPVSELVYGLARGSFTAEQGIALIEKTAQQTAEERPFTIRVASATDPGRRRDHNEDNCYPNPNEQTIIVDGLQNCVAIVCDGLGGHEGGEVASRMAIESLCHQLEPVLASIEKGETAYQPEQFVQQLEQIVKTANDGIVALNDQQQRTAQRRMGTTLVMTVLPRPKGKPTHEVYVVSVGDSRIYWIGTDSCRQVTLDDDVATRESTLGLNFYGYSSQRMDAGALIQALGTRSSDVLVPRIQRFLLDEECLIMLCSDGLSDYERVVEMFPSHIRPILTDRLSLTTSCQNLINQGNFLNGHDNITVVLMRCQSAPYGEVDVALQQKMARSRKFATTKATTTQSKPDPVADRTQFITNESTTTIQTTTTKLQPKIKTSPKPGRTPAPKKRTTGWTYFAWGVIFLSAGFAIGTLVIFNIPFLQQLLRSTSPVPTEMPTPPPPSPNRVDSTMSIPMIDF